MKELELEKQKLDQIIKDYKEYLEDVKLEYNNVNKFNIDNEEIEKKKISLNKKISLLEQNINKPYFGRIDFKNYKDNVIDKCYIGKLGVINYDNEIITVDWRAPIASLYYDSNIGFSKYKVEENTVEGELILKRQYNIENKELLSFNDVDTVSNDELLKPYLDVSADARLKNIVSTIQHEQNMIIRSSINNNLVVQGVAGSGKTTVALHRIAYLVYNYRNIIANNQYMVIGPNKFFINYISSVLPDLDVNDVKQYDLIEFVNKYLNEKILLKKGYTKICKLKNKMEFKFIIDKYINEYKKNNFPKDDIKIKDFILLKNCEIIKFWDEIDDEKYDILSEKIDRLILLLDKYLQDNHDNIILKINKHYDVKLEVEKDISKIRKDRISTIQQFEKNHKVLLKKHFSKMLKKTTIIYKNILNNLKEKDYKFDGNFYYEDLTPLLYINYKIYGSKEYKNMRHVVIDEAQDYNELTFYVLKTIMNKATFSIYGDLAQSLYPYRSLENWNDTKEKVFQDNIEIKYLSKSYRTSIEIMHEANKINHYLNLPEAEAVIRHADDVKYFKSDNKILDIEYHLKDLISKGLKSVAIICKDECENVKIYDSLKKKFDISKIDESNQEYNGNICVITSKLSKGLEFDGVIITNADEKNYKSENTLDMKLLYVSMTRAMHNLIILYENNLCKPLKF